MRHSLRFSALSFYLSLGAAWAQTPAASPKPAPKAAAAKAAVPIKSGTPLPNATPPTPAQSANETRSRQMLVDALADKNPDVRKQAVVALGLAGGREPYVSLVDSMLTDKDVYVRLAAVATLVDLRSERTVGALQRALYDEAPEVSFAAAKQLWALSDAEGRKVLLSVLSGESKTSSGFITSQRRDTLRMFHTPKTMFLFALKQGVGLAPVPGLGEGVSSLQDLLSDANVSGRATAALLMGSDKGADVLEALRDALRDKDSSVRAAAVHALALRGNPAQLEDISPLLNDSKEAVRLRAAAAYIRLMWIRAGSPGASKGAAAVPAKVAIPATSPSPSTLVNPAPKKPL